MGAMKIGSQDKGSQQFACSLGRGASLGHSRLAGGGGADGKRWQAAAELVRCAESTLSRSTSAKANTNTQIHILNKYTKAKQWGAPG